MEFGRLMTAMLTPFTSQGDIDEGEVKRLVTHLIATGTDTIVVGGTTGESPTLTADERTGLIKVVKATAAGKAKVIAGTGTNSTRDTIANSKEAVQAGADGLMVVTPYYNKPPQDSLYEHYAAIAREVDIPTLIYNVPGRTACNILPRTLAKLATIDVFFGVKEASGSLDQVSEIIRTVPERFLVYSGDDSLTLPMMAVGAVGVVSVCSHIVGAEMKQMIEYFVSGNTRRATKAHLDLMPVFKALFVTTSPIPLKWAMNHLGLPAGNLRAPLFAMGAAEEEVVLDALRLLGKVTS
ncbi:MAG: 4-hydroxy-tetrahydrodipicolinate synthase [Bacillota bacterium]|nr:4-hydroxy-tetrahydrodipicolinate synthase [Bacillota bacterium]